jgi:hypothetical protein
MLNYTGNRSKIIEYMQYQVMHHMDGAHVNCTALAEDAWNQCESGEDIHPDFFEWAFEVACEFEAYINQLAPDEIDAIIDGELSSGQMDRS